MFIKSFTRKSKYFGSIVRYLLRHPITPQSWRILQNMDVGVDDVEGIIREFQENAKYKKERKGGIYAYHEILSLGSQDKVVVMEKPWIMYELAQRYLALRNPDCIALIVPHFDTDSPHCHILLSNNRVRSPKAARISKGQYNQIKDKMEEIIRSEYKELQHSSIERKRGNRRKQSIGLER